MRPLWSHITRQIRQVEVVPNEPEAGMLFLDNMGVNGHGSQNGSQLVIGGWVKGPAAADVSAERPYCLQTAVAPILILRHDPPPYFAYKNECAPMAMPLDGGLLDAESAILTCPWHGFRYDITSGECLTAPQAQLEPYPVRIQGGHVWVRPG